MSPVDIKEEPSKTHNCNKTRLLVQHPLHYMSFTTINNELVKWLNSTSTHDMSELTLWWHGSEVGHKFDASTQYDDPTGGQHHQGIQPTDGIFWNSTLERMNEISRSIDKNDFLMVFFHPRTWCRSLCVPNEMGLIGNGVQLWRLRWT